MRDYKISVTSRLFPRTRDSLERETGCFLLSALLSLFAVVSSAEELLWCSGSRAESPLCVEFRAALDSKAKARSLYEQLISVVHPPWDARIFSEAVARYEEAGGLFADEYFGEASDLYIQSTEQFEFLARELKQAVKARRSLIGEVRTTRQFSGVLEAIQDLEDWGEVDFSITRSDVLSMVSDEILIAQARAEFREGNLANARITLSGLESGVFEFENKNLLRDIEEEEARRNFSKFVSMGMSSVDKGEYSEARRFFLEAKKINPSSTTVETNLELLQKLERSIEIERLQKERLALIEAKNFARALEVIEALEELDSSLAFGEEKEFFREVVNIEREVDILLPQMTSMSSSKLRRAVEALILKVDKYDQSQRYGPRLDNKLEELRRRYNELSVKTALALSSDGKAEISLRPGGRLGNFKEMALRVYPGSYKLIARCPGLREKVVALEIPVGMPSFERYIDCY